MDEDDKKYKHLFEGHPADLEYLEKINRCWEALRVDLETEKEKLIKNYKKAKKARDIAWESCIEGENSRIQKTLRKMSELEAKK